MSFPDGAQFARLDLPDDEYLTIAALQAVDRGHAARGVTALRRLHAQPPGRSGHRGSMNPYDLLFRHVATRVPAELTHRVGVTALRVATPLLGGAAPGAPVEAMGLEFANPLGVAAGYDKDAEGVRGLARLGFGAVEVGTVTARPQPGNPRPRLFRLPADRALVNRMGFNNAGADVVAARLAAVRARGAGTVVGVNIGRSKTADGRRRRLPVLRARPRPARRLRRGQRQLPEHPGPARPAGRRRARAAARRRALRGRRDPAAREDHRGPGRRRRSTPSPTSRWPRASTGSSRPTRRSRAPGWPRRPTS